VEQVPDTVPPFLKFDITYARVIVDVVLVEPDTRMQNSGNFYLFRIFKWQMVEIAEIIPTIWKIGFLSYNKTSILKLLLVSYLKKNKKKINLRQVARSNLRGVLGTLHQFLQLSCLVP